MSQSTLSRIFIKNLIFSDGTDVSFSDDDVVIIVGPNNAGKSATLRAIDDRLKAENSSSPVINNIVLKKVGTLADLETFMEVFISKKKSDNPNKYDVFGTGLNPQHLEHVWSESRESALYLGKVFCSLLNAETRLAICKPPTSISLTESNPVHPIHYIQRDDVLEKELSKKFLKAFGVEMIVHRNAGNIVPLYVGEAPTLTNEENLTSLSYVKRLEKLETLQTQGDGMRSFAGVLLSTSVGRESILLIDEPEAFLHPPQAKLLGSILVLNNLIPRQLFVSTHSTDILRGVLDTESNRVRIIRIERKNEVNNVRILDNSKIKQLWKDPLLRYSNALDGLFHEGVIVCESDSDCRFYSAIFDAIYSNSTDNERKPDLMFTSCWTNNRLSLVVRALRALGVKVHVITDFDIFSAEQPLHKLTDALEIEWSGINQEWEIVKKSVDEKIGQSKSTEVKDEISKIILSVSEDFFPTKAKDRIASVLKKCKPWAKAKAKGKKFLPETSLAPCESLLSKLKIQGLHVVELGELESFHPIESLHGPSWVNHILENELIDKPELKPARDFMHGIVTSMKIS